MLKNLSTTVVAAIVGAVVAGTVAYGVVASQQSSGTSAVSQDVTYDGS